MNWKRFATKFADLKDQTTYNQINKVFGYLVDFGMKEFFNPWLTSIKAQLIYNWTMTIVESLLTLEEKKEILKVAVEDLVQNEYDRKQLIGILEEGNKIKEKIVIKEVVKYIERVPIIYDIEVNIEKYLPITFLSEDGKNDEFKEYIIDAYRKNKALGIHQFAYIAYYMLFISFLYKVVWELKNITTNTSILEQIDKLINNNGGSSADIFDLSAIQESDFCRSINTFVRCLHRNEIDEIVNFVQKRNHCAHPSGIIQYNVSEVENLIEKIDIYTEKIQKKINNELLSYIKENLDKIFFDKKLMLSEAEIFFLIDKKDEILKFNSDSEENINKKTNFLNLIYNNYTEMLNFGDGELFNLFVKIFDGYDNNINLYYIIQNMHFYIKSFSKNELNKLINIIENLGLTEDDKTDCIGYIRNI